MSEELIYTEDYSVECGFKEIAATSKVGTIKWRYRLWASGVAECWGVFDVTSSTSENTTGSGEYRSDLFSVTLPFKMVAFSEPVIDGTATQSCSITNAAYSKQSEVTFRLSRASAIPTDSAIKTRLHVLAEWVG